MSDVLIVEDEKNLRELMRDLLGADGFVVETCETIAEAEAVLRDRAPDLLILDLKLPDGDGLDLFERTKQRGATTPAIVITAFGTVEKAVRAMHAGAADFLVKPFDNQRLRTSAAAALAHAKKLDEIELAAGRASSPRPNEIVGASGGLKSVVTLLKRVASSDATVLLQGESGTGKQVFARAIHESSARLDAPFVAIDCSSIPSTLIEAELFGFERGSFTGAHAERKGRIETAHGGTLFLDEIGDMPLETQSRLLHVLQEREITRIGGRAPIKVDVRIIAATHRDLAQLVEDGRFRQDLLYRLNVVPIFLPPLRERKEDIPGLVDHFLEKHAARHRASPPRPTRELYATLNAHPWPGNVRELENFVERSVVLGDFDLATLKTRSARSASSPMGVSGSSSSSPEEEKIAGEGITTLRQAVAEAERSAVVAALRHAKGNKAHAARLLGISYKTLFNKMHEHGIKEAITID